MKELFDLLDYTAFIKNKKQVKEILLKDPYLIEKKIAILCGGTVGEIKEFMTVFLLYHGIRPVFWEGDHGRYHEQACFDDPELSAFAPDIVIMHMNSRNLLYYDRFPTDSDVAGMMREEQDRLRQIWGSLAEKYHCTIIQNNFAYLPYRVIGNASRISDSGNVRYIDDLNRYISDHARTHQDLFVNDVNYLSAYVGLRDWYDDRMWDLYKCPMSATAMPYYALSIVNIIKSILGKNKKAVITDLDDTLWGGIIGEIGAGAVRLGKETPQGEAYIEIHRYLKELGKNGVILNICSKNEYDTGLSGLKTSRSILREEDFVVKKIDWNDKAENVREILSELNISEDAAVFLDDSEFECDRVKGMMPEIVTLRSSNIYELLEKIDLMSYFEITQRSQEDDARRQMYGTEMLRKREQQKFKDHMEYLASLGMKCKVDAISDENVARVTQLFNKTNQFNFMTNRYTPDSLVQKCEDPDIGSFVLGSKDRFGDNGIVSAALVKFDEEGAHITDWVMSCRVFGRGLEDEMLEQICIACRKRGIAALYGYYRETRKNKKIKDLYRDLGLEKDPENDRWVCRDINGLSHEMEKRTSHIEEE